MQRPIIEQAHPGIKLLFVAFLIVVGALVVMVVAALVGLLFFSPSEIIASFSGNLDNIAILKYFQMAQTIGLFIVPALLAGVFFSKNTPHFLHFNRSNISGFTVILVVFIMLAGIPLIDFIGYANQKMILPDFLSGLENWMFQMEEASKVIIEKFTKVHTTKGLLINILMIGILPALGEEMLFRGTIQPLMKSWLKNNHAAIWVTAFLFSALHMQFYGFFPRMLLGAVMGYMLVWSGTLWLPIIAHFVNNTAGVVLYFLYYNNMVDINPDSLGYESDILPLILSLLFVTGLLFLLKKRCIPTKEGEETLTFYKP